jgi:hypothetical protein
MIVVISSRVVNSPTKNFVSKKIVAEVFLRQQRRWLIIRATD